MVTYCLSNFQFRAPLIVYILDKNLFCPIAVYELFNLNIFYLFFADRDIARRYVAKLLDVRNNRRSEVCIRGQKVELALRQRLYRKLKDKGISILAQFNYLECQELLPLPAGNQEIPDDEINDADEATYALQNHDETCFKRKHIARILIDQEFKKKSFVRISISISCY